MKLRQFGNGVLVAAALLLAGSTARAQVTSNGNFTFQCGTACTTTGNGYNTDVFALYLDQGGNYSFYATGSQGDQFDFLFYSDPNHSNLVASTPYFTGANQRALAGTLDLPAGQYYVAASATCQSGNNGCRTTLQSFQLQASAMETPEPASMTLLGTGLVGVMAFLRRRRKAQQESPDPGPPADPA